MRTAQLSRMLSCDMFTHGTTKGGNALAANTLHAALILNAIGISEIEVREYDHRIAIMDLFPGNPFDMSWAYTFLRGLRETTR
jgi:hypothetical protein